MADIEQYIQNWKQQDQKPCNEEVFIGQFLNFLNGVDDCRDVSFNGDGSYFGKQITITKDAMYRTRNVLCFEVAYSATQIRVYDGHCEGFWTPEYIRLEAGQPMFPEVKDALAEFMLRIFGIKDLK